MHKELRSFEDLDAWNVARQVVNQVYGLTQSAAIQKDFGLCSQLQRAAVSVMSNIAEGFERSHVQEKIQFYSIARGSCGEIRSLLYVVADNYPTLADRAATVRELVMRTGKLVSGLITATRHRKRNW